MKKIDVGNLISVIANVGVIAGIVFLAFELRQNNEWLASESRYNHTAARVSYHQTLATDDILADVMAKARRGEMLSDAERLRLWNIYFSVFAQWQWEFQEAQLGRIEMPVQGLRGSFSNQPGTNVPYFPLMRETWHEVAASFEPGFREFMEREVLP